MAYSIAMKKFLITLSKTKRYWFLTPNSHLLRCQHIGFCPLIQTAMEKFHVKDYGPSKSGSLLGLTIEEIISIMAAADNSFKHNKSLRKSLLLRTIGKEDK